MRFRSIRLLSPSILLMTVGSQAPAQEFDLAQRLCGECRLTIQRIGRLGTPEGVGGLVGAPSSVSVDRSGRYYVTDYMNAAEITVFAADGKPLRKLGRKGSGPGEFRSIRYAHIEHDTLYVFDTPNRRMSVLDLQGRSLRTIPFPWPTLVQAVLINPELFVVAAMAPTRELAGLPLHTFSPTKGMGRSFGARAPLVRPDSPHLNERTIWPATSTEVWAAKRTAYELELWNATGEMQYRLRRNADWFKPYLERPLGTNKPPGPWIMGVRKISPDLLLALISVPASNFTQALGPKVLQAGRETYDFDRERLLFDTIIEIIDIPSKSVVWHQRLDDYLIGFVPGAMQIYSVDHHDGVPIIDLFSFSFSTQWR